MIDDPEGVEEVLTPVPGGKKRSLRSGGLRYAATTGYYLRALRAGNHPLPREEFDAG